MRGRWTLAAVGLATVAACARNPATGKRQLDLVPARQEIAIGAEAAQEVVQTVGVYEEPRLGRYVAAVGQRLAEVPERPKLTWTFRVVDDATVNAFALPGGHIFVTRGLLAHLNNEAQLAAVLGHEIGHVTGKHALSRISKAQLAQLGLGLGMLLSEEVRRYGQIGTVGLSLLFLKFSRNDENEADGLGLRYAQRAGYDVREMPGLFATLKRAAGGEERLPQWLSTHPDPEDRIERTRQRIAALDLSRSRMMIDVEEYLVTLNGMAFGPNPRQGYFEGDRYLHPELRFTMVLPGGWRKLNLRDAVVATSPRQDAAIQVTIAEGGGPENAYRAFATQPGVRAVAPVSADLGLPPHSARFAAETDEGPIAGLVTFLSHHGRAYQILSFAAEGAIGAHLPAFAATHASFKELTDPAALQAEPRRLTIERAPAATTLAELYRERPAAVPLETIATLNQMEPGTPLVEGQLVKWVSAGRRAPETARVEEPAEGRGGRESGARGRGAGR